MLFFYYLAVFGQHGIVLKTMQCMDHPYVGFSLVYDEREVIAQVLVHVV